MDTKDIYLRKGGSIIGLHAVGTKGPYTVTIVGLDGVEKQETLDFKVVEMWGNRYNQDFKMIGRGSFRLHGYSLEKEAQDFEVDGWVRFERYVEEVL